MEIYDILMLIVLVSATLLGAWKGMVWQLASLTSLVISYYAALRLSERMAPYFGQQAPWNRFVAMAVIYVLTSLVVWLLFRIVSNWIERVRLHEFDRHLGAIFGAAKGVLLCIVITFFALTLSDTARANVLRSHSGHYIAMLLNRADNIMPRELHEVLDPYLKRMEKELEPAGQQSPRTAGRTRRGY